jgi:hypothetical protein
MKHVMKIISHGDAFFEGPSWIKSYDLEANGGFGRFEITSVEIEALRFDDFYAAIAAWNTRSASRPSHEDGRPNRPMSVFGVEIVAVED